MLPTEAAGTRAPELETQDPAGPSAIPTTPSAAAPPPARAAWGERPVVAFVRRHAALFLFLGALLLLLPGLGYGFWDPWETHYAEVARRILADGDWISLHWGDADSAPADVGKHFLFFSKPILTFWLMALSFLVFGVSEAAARLPIVLLCAGAVAGTFYYLRRLVSERAALLSSVLLLLTPMWAMLGRHAMTDMPFVAPVAVGTLAFAAVLLDPRTDPRHAYVGYVCLALATLAKGLLGFLLPGAVLLAMLAVAGDWSTWRRRRVADRPEPIAAVRRWRTDLLIAVALASVGALVGFLAGGKDGARWGGALGGALAATGAILAANGDRWKRLRMPLGIPIFLLLCATWYVPVILRHGMAFVREFFYVHHFGRATTGAGLDLTGLDIHDGTLGYYLQQLGYALFPWIVALPAAAVAWARHAATERGLFATAAAGDRSGERPTGALLVLAIAWAVIPYVVFTTSQVKFHHYIFPSLPALAIVAGVGLDRLVRQGVGRWEALGLLAGGVLLALVWRELRLDPHRLVRLFSYRYTRRFPEFPWMRIFLVAALALAAAGGLWALFAGWRRGRRGEGTGAGFPERLGGPALIGGCLLASAVLSGAAMWGHVPEMSHWISQQDAFAALDAEPRRPSDRLVSWANNWRGEVIYSRDRVTVIEPGDKRAEAKLRGILRQPGRVFFVTTDARGLRGAVTRVVGAPAARTSFRLLTAEGSGGFAAAVYDGPTAGTYEPRVAERPAGLAAPAGAGGAEVTLNEPQGRGRLALVGVRLAPAQVRRGSTVTVDLYFRCDAPTSRDWDVFIHADGPPPSRQPRVGNGDHGFTGGAVATSACRRGELLLDRWALEISAGAGAGTYQVFAGLWHPPSGDRMRVEPAAAVRSPGAETGEIEPEQADRAYVGDIVVVQ